MRQCTTLCAVGLCAALSAGAALADGAGKSSMDPTFGSRTDKPDGSSALTIGRRLPTEWETKFGTDVSLAPQQSAVPSENLLNGTVTDRSTGAVWGSIAMPGFRPLGFDKTSVEARVDGGKDEGKVGATVSRSVPLGQSLSVTWQNSYSVVQPLAPTAAPVTSTMPLATNVPTTGMIVPPTSQTRVFDEALRFDIAPSGTTFSAGASSSTADNQWHNKFSIEQTLAGPLKVTTSVEDAGAPISNKSITAGFKKVW
jgi:hypothetical protein